MDWDKLRVFYNVADSGSLTHAASRLGITQSAVSRQISGLEDRVGSPLFQRHVRGLVLTEQGEILFRTVRGIFSDLVTIQDQISKKNTIIQGTLKVAVTKGFGTNWLSPRLGAFFKKNPDTLLEITMSDDPMDLGVQDSDVVISSSVTQEEGLVYKQLLQRPLNIYASRNYLFKHGVPIKPKDLDQHQLIAFPDKTLLPYNDVNWILSCGTLPGIKREAYLSISNLGAIAKAVEAGNGIACLPTYVANKHKRLVQILPEAKVPHVAFYFVYSKQLRNSKKVDQFWDFLNEEARCEDEKMMGENYV